MKQSTETSGAVSWNDLCDVYEDAVSWVRQQPEDEQDWTIIDRIHKLIEAAPDGEKAVRDAEVERLRAERDAARLIVEELQALRDTLYGQLDSAAAGRDALAAQVAAIRTLITEDYGADYDDEDVPAAVERLMRHLSEHEANMQRILQSKNEAIELAQTARAATPATSPAP